MISTVRSDGGGVLKRCTCGWEYAARYRMNYSHIREAGDAASQHLVDSYRKSDKELPVRRKRR